MILSHRHQFIFFFNGKTGSTSIQKALAHLDESKGMDILFDARNLWAAKHVPPAVIKAFLPKNIWNNYYKMVFVRHPQDWFVSQYRYNFSKPKLLLGKRDIVYPWRMLKRFEEYKKHKVLAEKKIYDENDVDFLFQYLRIYRGLPLSPGLMQSNYVYDPDGEMLVDFVGKFENLQADFEHIMRKLGLNFELPHLNKTSGLPWQDCLTPEASARIGELWKIDFANFGYELELGRGHRV